MPFVWTSRVRYVDTDASGRIHFTAMLRHFEAAEIEFMRSLGEVFTEARRSDISLPRVRVECTYTASVRYDDVLDIAVSVARVGNASYELTFEATVEGNLVAQGSFIVVAMDNQTQRSRALPEALARMLRGRQPGAGAPAADSLPGAEQAPDQD